MRFFFFFAATAGSLCAQTDLQVYTDSLQPGWVNYSWSSTINFSGGPPVHSGTSSIATTITAGWGAIYLHHAAFDSSGYTNLTFWIHGGSAGGQRLLVQATLNGAAQTPGVTLSPLTTTWQQYKISLAALGVANQPNMDGFWLQDQSGAAAPVFYLDDVSLVAGTNPPPPVTNSPVAILVDAQANQHPISPLIYGLAFASTAQLADLNATLNRSGGNSETRYNWQLNAHNKAADWYFESLDDGSATPADSADNHVSSSKSGGAEPMLTIPMIGWVPKLGAGRARLSSYSITKYGPQTGNDAQWFADAGNGIGTNSSARTSWLITTNTPNDANFATNSLFQQAFVQHLTNRWGFSTNGGVRYYFLDNEHSLWQSTHRDVHPVGPTMQEIRDRCFDYGAQVKTLDPNALVLGPEEWGWDGYFWSGFDQQWAGAHNDWNPAHFPDRGTNGGLDYMPWLLDQFRQRDSVTGQRLLDYFTLHMYPQGGEFGNDISTTMQLLRNRSTRSLWDTNYVDASWINSIVKLIPRMKAWVAAYYPGTRIGLTEYNWGAEPYINGATAQADVLGILGREGLDLATRWTTPDASTPTYKAMKMYRNYDGARSGFGDTSVSATGPNPDNVAVFAALRSTDNALTFMVINKRLTTGATASVTVTNRLLAGTGQAWQLTSANQITRLPDFSFSGGNFTNTVPAQSVTLFVLAAGAVPRPVLRPGTMGPAGSFDLWLDGVAGQRYVLLSTTDFRAWTPVFTNTLSSNSWHAFLPPTSAPQTFFRAQWLH